MTLHGLLKYKFALDTVLDVYFALYVLKELYFMNDAII